MIAAILTFISFFVTGTYALVQVISPLINNGNDRGGYGHQLIGGILHNDQNVDDRKKAVFEALDRIKSYTVSVTAEAALNTGDIDEMQRIIDQLRKTKKPTEGGN